MAKENSRRDKTINQKPKDFKLSGSFKKKVLGTQRQRKQVFD